MVTEEKRKEMEALNKAIAAAMNTIDHRILVFSGKGGVGKTTVSAALAFHLAKLGYDTALLDADVTGPNIPKMLGLRGKMTAVDEIITPMQKKGVAVVSLANAIPEDAPVMWRGPMRSKVLYQFLGGVAWGQRDYLLADLPPGTGDEVMTLAEKMEPDFAVIVTTPQEVSLIDSGRSISMARQLNIPNIGIVENMSGFVCPECGHEIDLFGSGGGKKQAENMGVTFLGQLPAHLEARRLADTGRLDEVIGDNSPFARGLGDIASAIESRLAISPDKAPAGAE